MSIENCFLIALHRMQTNERQSKGSCAHQFVHFWMARRASHRITDECPLKSSKCHSEKTRIVDIVRRLNCPVVVERDTRRVTLVRSLRFSPFGNLWPFLIVINLKVKCVTSKQPWKITRIKRNGDEELWRRQMMNSWIIYSRLSACHYINIE